MLSVVGVGKVIEGIKVVIKIYKHLFRTIVISLATPQSVTKRELLFYKPDSVSRCHLVSYFLQIKRDYHLKNKDSLKRDYTGNII
jgi:hypothetical protein